MIRNPTLCNEPRRPFEEIPAAELRAMLSDMGTSLQRVIDLNWAARVLFHETYRRNEDNEQLATFMETAATLSGEIAADVSRQIDEVL